MKERPTKIRFETVALVLTALVLFAHFFALMTYSVNVPFADEWGGSFFYPGLQTKELNWSYIFGFHNEHRIVWTRLQVWLAYYLFNLNFNAFVAVNFLIYSVGSCLYLGWLGKTFNASVAIVGLVFASTLAAGNHILAFQGQIHFSILFFLAAIALLVQGGRRILLSSVLAVCGIYSAGLGMTFGGFYLGLCIVLIVIDRANRRYLLPALLLVLAALGVWFIGFPKHDNLSAGLFSAEVWQFYFNLITSGLGYSSYTVIPGVLCLALFLTLAIISLFQPRSQPLRKQFERLGLLTICCAFLGVLFVIAIGRTRLGLNEAKSSRYTEIILFLIPALLALLQSVMRSYPKRALQSAGYMPIPSSADPSIFG